VFIIEARRGKKDEVKYTFDVSKCDRLFDVLVRVGMIRLTEGHVVPSVDHLAMKKYCKWHDSDSHVTNKCNYFRRQVQSAINDGRLTLQNSGKMKLDIDPFPVNMVELEGKQILVQTDQAETTKCKQVVVSDELRSQMIKPRSLEIGTWKENFRRRLTRRVKPTFAMLIEKCIRCQHERVNALPR
jgi:hypothetical protein